MTIHQFQEVTPPCISAPIEQHLNFLCQHIFYDDRPSFSQPVIFHGAQHAAETAFFSKLLLNFYKKHQPVCDNEAPEHFDKLIQITCLLHDIGRESDYGEDRWDLDSAESAYHYFTAAGVDNEDAHLFSATIANKDTDENGGFLHRSISCHSPSWSYSNQPYLADNPIFLLAREILHNADCLQVMRARRFFNGQRYLDRKQLYHNKKHSDISSIDDEFNLFIRAARGLMHSTGSLNASAVAEFAMNTKEFNNRYYTIQEIALQLPYFKSLFELSHPGQFEEKGDTRAKQWDAEHDEYFLRAVTNPDKNPCGYDYELHFQSRTLGSSLRSVSYAKRDKVMQPTITGVMQLHSMDLEKQKPKGIFISDQNTGYGTKQKHSRTYTKEQAQAKLDDLERHPLRATTGHKGNNNEVILTWLHISTCVALAYADGKDFCSRRSFDVVPDPKTAQAISFLRVIYMQKLHQKTKGESLPVFCYSATNQSLVRYQHIDNEQKLNQDIIQSWRTILTHRPYYTPPFSQFQSALNYAKVIFAILGVYHFSKHEFNTYYPTHIMDFYSAELKNRITRVCYQTTIVKPVMLRLQKTDISEQDQQHIVHLAKLESQLPEDATSTPFEKNTAWTRALKVTPIGDYPYNCIIANFHLTHTMIHTLNGYIGLNPPTLKREMTRVFDTVCFESYKSQQRIHQSDTPSTDRTLIENTPFDIISAAKPNDARNVLKRHSGKRYQLTHPSTLEQQSQAQLKQLDPISLLQEINTHYKRTLPAFTIGFNMPFCYISCNILVGISIITTAISLKADEDNIERAFNGLASFWFSMLVAFPIALSLLLSIRLSCPRQSKSKQPKYFNRQHNGIDIFCGARAQPHLYALQATTSQKLTQCFNGAMLYGLIYFKDEQSQLRYKRQHESDEDAKWVTYNHICFHLAPVLVLCANIQETQHTQQQASTITPLLSVTSQN